MDRRRPQINAWLAICACEMGRVQIAKQTIRQVLCFQDKLDPQTALQLVEVLLRFSDESQALPGERPKLVESARYAREAIAVAHIAFNREESGKVHDLLGQAHAMLGEDEAAVAEFRLAIQQLHDGERTRQDKAMASARTCAARLIADPQCALLVEQDIAAVRAKRHNQTQIASS